MTNICRPELTKLVKTGFIPSEPLSKSGWGYAIWLTKEGKLWAERWRVVEG